MLFVFANFWGWILAALVLGSFVGWVTWSYEQRESWLRTWLRWWGLAFVIGLLLILFKALPGRAGLYLETAIWLFAVYIVGCFVGGWLRAAFGSEPVTVSGKSKLVDQLPARVAPSQAASARVAPVWLSSDEGNAANSGTSGAEAATATGVKPQGLLSRPDDSDDLKWIRGVGPANEKALNDLGVWRFRQIGDWTSENSDWVSKHINFPGRIAREDWIGQARLLADGKRTAYANFVASGAIVPGADADTPLSDADIAVVRGDIASGGVEPVGARLAEMTSGGAESLSSVEGNASQEAGGSAATEATDIAQAADQKAAITSGADSSSLAAGNDAGSAPSTGVNPGALGTGEGQKGGVDDIQATIPTSGEPSFGGSGANLAAVTEHETSASAATNLQDQDRPSALASAIDNQADDLKLIKGIGPKNEKICNELGVFHFSQIADWSPENAVWFGKHMRFPGRIERELWIPQAKLLAYGIDTEHSAAVRSGSVVIDDSADAPLSEADAAKLADALPKNVDEIVSDAKQQQAAQQADAADEHRPAGLLVPINDRPDDLKLIKGIGPKNEKICNELGVFHFSQIADWSPENAVWFGKHMRFPGRIERELWIPQAKLLAAGIDTPHSLAIKAGSLTIDEKADEPLNEADAAAFASDLPQEMAAVEGESSHDGRRPLGLADARGGKADDLKRIKGIGKQNEARLHALGVWHFDQIAAWSGENVKWVGSYLAFPGRITREDWINQAKALAQGGETEFSKRVAEGKVATSKDDGTLGQGNVADLTKH